MTVNDLVSEIRNGRKNLRWANLSGADLSGANLSGADLRWAYLRGADLRWAYLRRVVLDQANLSMCRGLMWAQAGPIGTDRRTLTGAIVGAGITLFAGCFTGTPTEFRQAVEASGYSGWGWPQDDDRLKAECLAAHAYVVANLNSQSEARNG